MRQLFQDVNDPGRDRAFNHASVATIVKEIMAIRDTRLVSFAKVAILSDATGKVDALLGVAAARDGVLRAAASRVAAAGKALLANDRGEVANLRGALLERLVYELVRTREPETKREQRIRLTASTWSKPKEVVTDADPVEVYECKRWPKRFEQADLSELDAIRDAVTSHGRVCRPTLAALEPRGNLKRALEGRTWKGPIYWAAEEELMELGDAPPSRRLSSL